MLFWRAGLDGDFQPAAPQCLTIVRQLPAYTDSSQKKIPRQGGSVSGCLQPDMLHSRLVAYGKHNRNAQQMANFQTLVGRNRVLWADD